MNGRAIAYGTLWLNNALSTKARPQRILRSSIRLTPVEIVWVSIISIAIMILMSMLLWQISKVSPRLAMLLFATPLIGPIVGWNVGPKIARASPYQRSTGEGMVAYLYVQGGRKVGPVGYLFGRRAVSVKAESYITGTKRTSDAVVWVGSARATRVPTGQRVSFRQRYRQTNWISKSAKGGRR